MSKKYWNYMRDKQYLIAGLIVALLLLGIAGMVMLPHIMQQWSRDRAIGTLHVITGISLGGVGLVVLRMLYKQVAKGRGEAWKKYMFHLALWYIVVQIFSGIIQGTLGVLLYEMGVMTYEMTKGLLFIMAGVWQNMLRVWFAFLIIEKLYESVWKEDKRIIVQAELAAMLLSLITVGLSAMNSGIWQNTIKVVWEVLFFAGFSIYFGMTQRGKRSE